MKVSATTGIALVWTVGAIVGGIRLLRIQRRLARLRRNATEPDSDLLTAAREVQARLGVRRSVSVRVSAEATSPFVSGLWHPVIIVPAELLRNLAPAQVPALLSHEMAHLRSRDLAWCVAWRWVKTLGWPHPLLWRAPASHNLACEQEADRIASDHWDDRSQYASMLAQLTLRVMELPAVETTLSLNGASQIVKRLALLRRDRFGRWKWRDSLAGFSLIAGLALVAGGWGISTARAQDPADSVTQRLAEQQRPRTVVPFDPPQFDQYVGFYQFGPNVFASMTRRGDHYFTQLTGQPEVELFPESPTKFFATVVAAQVSFVTDAQGKVTEMVLHQGGIEQHAPKVDQSVVNSGAAALAERIKNNLPDPDRVAPLRRFIDALIAGQPNLDDMSPALAAAVKNQWSATQKQFEGAGAFKSLEFKKVGAQGMDIYVATFENRQVSFRIGPLTPDHKIQGLLMRPVL
jgi:beta-lactamase regulating signal transducer with metallopeptidase domain